MAIDFPNSPTTGDLHTVNGKQWQWDSEKWIAYGVSLAPDVLKVDSGNNRVGINQTSPAYSLDVTGTARITGDLTVQGTTTTIESAAVNPSLVFEGATADAYETTLTLVDPTADRTITLPDATGTVALTGGASTAVTVADTTDTTCFVGLFESATGDLGPKSDAGITYNAGTGTLTATAFAGPLTGNVTGNASGTALTVTQAAQTAITSVGTLTGLTMSGAIDAGEQIISQAIFKDVGETLATNGTSGSAATISLADGNFHKVTLTANCTFTFSNVPATANTAASFTLFLVQDGTGSRTATWPGTVDWAAATAPTLTTTAAGVDVLTFITLDGGTIWNGFVAGQAMG